MDNDNGSGMFLLWRNGGDSLHFDNTVHPKAISCPLNDNKARDLLHVSLPNCMAALCFEFLRLSPDKLLIYRR